MMAKCIFPPHLLDFYLDKNKNIIFLVNVNKISKGMFFFFCKALQHRSPACTISFKKKKEKKTRVHVTVCSLLDICFIGFQSERGYKNLNISPCFCLPSFPPRLGHACWVVVGASVDGQWQEWSSWSDCSVTCANGTQQRTRQCSAAAHGGSECRGHWAESRECHNPDCTGKNPEPLNFVSTFMSKLEMMTNRGLYACLLYFNAHYYNC